MVELIDNTSQFLVTLLDGVGTGKLLKATSQHR